MAQSGTASALRADSERYPGSNPGLGVEVVMSSSDLWFSRGFFQKAQENPGLGVETFKKEVLILYITLTLGH
jgi:hypothetical protein